MRILIADDDATSRVVLTAVVSKLGHDCLTASDGTSAWEQLSTQPVDVLLTDWMMPGLDGPELCARVRERFDDRYVYIVLITKLGNPEQVLEGMSAGADDYLIKPVDPFAVKTRMVAAERVIGLHDQLLECCAELERANVKLLDRSLTDALTGLGNRRRMDQDLERAHAHAVRFGRGYSLVLFDIDHFKVYNDHYGHLAGDDTLRDVAQQLQRATRAGERVYRYGGEEFLVLLPDAEPEDATVAADRLRHAVTENALPHDARPTTPPIVTLSGGISSWTPATPRTTTAELIRHADQALYHVKSTGGNRIHTTVIPHDCHPETPSPVAPEAAVRPVLTVEVAGSGA
jgi:diguanylate cyclase (GGDEF)-like protein